MRNFSHIITKLVPDDWTVGQARLFERELTKAYALGIEDAAAKTASWGDEANLPGSTSQLLNNLAIAIRSLAQ